MTAKRPSSPPRGPRSTNASAIAFATQMGAQRLRMSGDQNAADDADENDETNTQGYGPPVHCNFSG